MIYIFREIYNITKKEKRNQKSTIPMYISNLFDKLVTGKVVNGINRFSWLHIHNFVFF